METELEASRRKIGSVTADSDAAEDSVSDETQNALAEVEKLWDRRKENYDKIAATSDEQFEDMRDATVESWEELSSWIESGWSD